MTRLFRQVSSKDIHDVDRGTKSGEQGVLSADIKL